MSGRILLVDEDETTRESLELIVSAEGYEVLSADCAESALETLDAAPVEAVLCDIRIPGIDGFDLIPQILRSRPDVPIILISASGAEHLASQAIQRGAYDCLSRPFRQAEIRLVLLRAREREKLRGRKSLLEREMSRTIGDRAIVAASDGMIELLEILERVAAYKSTILVTGERGTGKEVIARAIHSQSPRREGPFVAQECSGLSESLRERELFGCVKDVSRGADRARRGLFAEADGGTLFLDEIADLPPMLQVKLLRAIQEEEIQPIGEAKSHGIDVRVIVATTRDLKIEITENRFCEDLFHRLNAVRLELPPLRQRRQDLPLLVDHFMARFRKELGKNVRRISDEALDLLVAYSWPGNVRELANMIERAMILTEDDSIETAALPSVIRNPEARLAEDGIPTDKAENFSLKPARQAFEARLIRRALVHTKGNRTHAARLLEISHRSLLYKIKDYGIRD